MPLDLATSGTSTFAPLDVIIGQASVSRPDVASLHRHLFAEGSLDRAEAEALFDLERAALTRCDNWIGFFIRAVTDHVVWGARPTGRLDDGQAGWLLAQVDAVRTPAAFAVLVNVLDEAQTVPSWFPSAVRARAVAGWPGVSRVGEAFSQPLRLAA